MHVGALGQRSRIWISNKRGLQIEASVFVESPREARNVLSSVALTRHKEWFV